jgi:DNA-binding response OmpR family regulator
VVEDHKRLLKSLERGLSAAGYEVTPTESADEAFQLARNGEFDVIVLDVALPERSGLEILTDLRNVGMGSPVLILSARGAVSDRVAGLDHGADDYLTKPFAFEELLARVRALMNRGVPGRRAILSIGDLEIHVPTQTVTRSGEEITLTRQEYRLLEYLVRHKNTTVTRQSISRDVWDEPQGLATNIVDVYINALRKKVEREGWKPLIQTIRGAGYTICDSRQDRHRESPV